MRIPFALSHDMASEEVQAEHCTEKRAPSDALIRFGLYRSVRGSHTMTASAPAASALRKTAPRFPGFSTLSRTTIRGEEDNLSSCRGRSFILNSAIIPSVLSL